MILPPNLLPSPGKVLNTSQQSHLAEYIKECETCKKDSASKDLEIENLKNAAAANDSDHVVTFVEGAGAGFFLALIVNAIYNTVHK